MITAWVMWVSLVLTFPGKVSYDLIPTIAAQTKADCEAAIIQLGPALREEFLASVSPGVKVEIKSFECKEMKGKL